jgi:hypothetical protein
MIVSAAMLPPFLVAVRDLNVFWPGVGPPEANPPLLVHLPGRSGGMITKYRCRTTECVRHHIDELFAEHRPPR